AHRVRAGVRPADRRERASPCPGPPRPRVRRPRAQPRVHSLPHDRRARREGRRGRTGGEAPRGLGDHLEQEPPSRRQEPEAPGRPPPWHPGGHPSRDAREGDGTDRRAVRGPAPPREVRGGGRARGRGAQERFHDAQVLLRRGRGGVPLLRPRRSGTVLTHARTNYLRRSLTFVVLDRGVAAGDPFLERGLVERDPRLSAPPFGESEPGPPSLPKGDGEGPVGHEGREPIGEGGGRGRRLPRVLDLGEPERARLSDEVDDRLPAFGQPTELLLPFGDSGGRAGPAPEQEGPHPEAAPTASSVAATRT